ncbi:MAG: flavodoxin family protein [Pseudomonadota bacterium]
MTFVAIVFHSGFGHTRSMAGHVLEGARSISGASAELFDVGDDEFDWSVVEDATAIIFGAPTYMGGLSGRFKSSIDRTGSIWSEQRWRGKLAAGFTTSSNASGDKLQALLQLVVLACQHGMFWVSPGVMPGDPGDADDPDNLNRLGGWVGAMAMCRHESNTTDLTPSDAATAHALGARVAAVALDFAGV